MRIMVLFPALLATACAYSGQSTAIAAASGAQPAKPVTTPILRTGKTISDQPLRLPQGAAEVVAAAIDLPAGAATPIHQHPWSRFVYVERGPIRIVNHDTGASLDFQTGTMLPEVVSQWHEARALAAPARLVVIDLVPPGVSNMVMKPSAPM